jgi:hypothetical protein
MTNRDRAHTLAAVANQRPVVAGLTTELRRSIGADAHTQVDLESAVDGVIRVRRRLQLTHTEDA